MTWKGSTAKDRLPSAWQTIRREVLDRDSYRCTAIKPNGTRCWDAASDVHKINDGDDRDPANLASLCSWHHLRATAREAARR